MLARVHKTPDIIIHENPFVGPWVSVTRGQIDGHADMAKLIGEYLQTLTERVRNYVIKFWKEFNIPVI